MPITNLDARLWQLEVALVARKLLALGCAYEARYSLPRDGFEDELTFQDFGLNVAAVANSHVFQVAETTGEPSRFATEFTDKDRARSIQVGDYLVGMGVEDFLVCPRSLEQLEQDGAKYDRTSSAEKTVVFHFVRMGVCVRDDPRPLGSILRTLDEVDASCAELLTRHELLTVPKQLAVEELQRTKELLTYVKILSYETRKVVMEDRKFQFAAKFREWYADITSGLELSTESTALDSTPESSEHDTCDDDPCIQCQWRIIWIPGCSTPSSPSTDRVEVADDAVPDAQLSQLESTPPQEKHQDEVTTAALVPSYGMADGRSYLLALVSPSTDIVASLEQLTIHVQNAPSLARNNEFIVAAGLKVRREIRMAGQSLYAARVRLGHLSFKFAATTGRDAVIGALLRLTRAVIEHRRLYGEMLSYLESEFGFCKDNDAQAVKDAALRYLVENKIVLFREIPSGEPDRTMYDVVAYIQEFPVICRHGSSLSRTKAEVVDALMLFILELVEEYQMSLVDHADQITNVLQDDYSEVVSYGDIDDFYDRIGNDDSRNADLRSMGTLRKRPLSPQKPEESCENERAALRPRLLYATVEPKTQVPPEASEPAVNAPTESPAVPSRSNESVHQNETTAAHVVECSEMERLHPSAHVNDTDVDSCSDGRDEDNDCSVADEEADKFTMAEDNALIRRAKEHRYVERTDSDDDAAKFRAVIRSLLTCTDEFRTGVNKLRSATNYAVETTIFPDIRARIKRTRLKGAITFTVDVNSVFHFKASKAGKFAACHAAIDGILNELDKTRLVWTQRLEILQLLQCVSSVECFRALKLSRVASIKTIVEDSTHPPSIRCAVQVDGHVVCRATCETKAKARRLAQLRAVQFIYSLVDCLESLEFSYKTTAASGRIDWSCRMEIQDTDDVGSYHKFQVLSTWCRPRIGMKPEGFPSQDIVATQQGTVPMERVETELLSLHESALACFSLMLPSSDPTEHRKFVRRLISYSELWGHEPRALVLTISPQCPYTLYLIPPGTTISSELDEALPRLDYRKSVIGILTKKRLDKCVSTSK